MEGVHKAHQGEKLVCPYTLHRIYAYRPPVLVESNIFLGFLEPVFRCLSFLCFVDWASKWGDLLSGDTLGSYHFTHKPHSHSITSSYLTIVRSIKTYCQRTFMWQDWQEHRTRGCLCFWISCFKKDRLHFTFAFIVGCLVLLSTPWDFCVALHCPRQESHHHYPKQLEQEARVLLLFCVSPFRISCFSFKTHQNTRIANDSCPMLRLDVTPRHSWNKKSSSRSRLKVLLVWRLRTEESLLS
jgi:hypothetical protein